MVKHYILIDENRLKRKFHSKNWRKKHNKQFCHLHRLSHHRSPITHAWLAWSTIAKVPPSFSFWCRSASRSWKLVVCWDERSFVRWKGKRKKSGKESWMWFGLICIWTCFELPLLKNGILLGHWAPQRLLYFQVALIGYYR